MQLRRYSFVMLLLVLLLKLPGLSLAQVDERVFDSKELLAREVEEQLIAPCCWRHPLNQHYSGTAEQMKETLRKMITDGQTQEEIINHYKSIYGERILSSPPNSGFNRMAYLFTPLMLLIGAGVILITLRRWRSGSLNFRNTEISGNTSNVIHQGRIDAELKEYD